MDTGVYVRPCPSYRAKRIGASFPEQFRIKDTRQTYTNQHTEEQGATGIDGD
jgi:hypothetical protein